MQRTVAESLSPASKKAIEKGTSTGHVLESPGSTKLLRLDAHGVAHLARMRRRAALATEA